MGIFYLPLWSRWNKQKSRTTENFRTKSKIGLKTGTESEKTVKTTICRVIENLWQCRHRRMRLTMIRSYPRSVRRSIKMTGSWTRLRLTTIVPVNFSNQPISGEFRCYFEVTLVALMNFDYVRHLYLLFKALESELWLMRSLFFTICNVIEKAEKLILTYT